MYGWRVETSKLSIADLFWGWGTLVISFSLLFRNSIASCSKTCFYRFVKGFAGLKKIISEVSDLSETDSHWSVSFSIHKLWDCAYSCDLLRYKFSISNLSSSPHARLLSYGSTIITDGSTFCTISDFFSSYSYYWISPYCEFSLSILLSRLRASLSDISYLITSTEWPK